MSTVKNNNGLPDSTFLGIEFGSTRIKAVLVDEKCEILATGAFAWENSFEHGYWTYRRDEIITGLQQCVAALQSQILSKFGCRLEHPQVMGISGMMHGYLAFDEDWQLLVPFRTWRNTSTKQASELLTAKLNFHIPQRWSIAHLFQAVLNHEEHVSRVRHITTLAGYVHFLLTGENKVGVGEASGMFPVAAAELGFDQNALQTAQELFDEYTVSRGFSLTIADLLPEIAPVGSNAGILSADGASLLDPTGSIVSGVVCCPPEADAATGMVATNSIKPRTGNISVGTSIFSMTVLEKPLCGVYSEIDVVATPTGHPVAMVHCNNGTTNINCWVDLFEQVVGLLGEYISERELYQRLFQMALTAESDAAGMLVVPYHSGEHIPFVSVGNPLIIHKAGNKIELANLMRAQLMSLCCTLRMGLDILSDKEQVDVGQYMAHGGFFQTPVVGQTILAAATNTPIAVATTAGEGGAWGMAVLAAYAGQQQEGWRDLAGYLDVVPFESQSTTVIRPAANDVEGFNAYYHRFVENLSWLNEVTM